MVVFVLVLEEGLLVLEEEVDLFSDDLFFVFGDHEEAYGFHYYELDCVVVEGLDAHGWVALSAFYDEFHDG